MNTVRILLSIAVHFNWDLQSLDVRYGFVQRDLKEEDFMELLHRQDKVCRLQKAHEICVIVI